jgi:hypothetical protein
MARITRLFVPDRERYEGVAPIRIWLLRLLYALMFFFVGSDSWTYILSHEGAWDPVRAVAFCVWAAYSTLSVLGLLRPLQMLPLVLFMIFYKSLWLVVVAYPLWSAGQLEGSAAEGMARVFAWIPLPILIVPWGYVARTYLPIGRGRARGA